MNKNKLPVFGSVATLYAAMAALWLAWTPSAQAQITITWPPLSATNTVGDNVEFYVGAANGSDTLTYQWNNSSGAIPGATGKTLVLTNIQTTNADTYTVNITDTTASLNTSASATLAVNTSFSPADGMVMWLPFSDGQSNPNSQTANDASGSGNGGTLQNFEDDTFEWVSGVTGPSGGALFFAPTNGASNNVVLVSDASSLTFTNTLHFSLSAWVTGDYWTTFDGSIFGSAWSVTQGGGIMAKGYGNGGEQFDMDLSSGKFRFFIRDGSGGTHGPNVLNCAQHQRGLAAYRRHLRRQCGWRTDILIRQWSPGRVHHQLQRAVAAIRDELAREHWQPVEFIDFRLCPAFLRRH